MKLLVTGGAGYIGGVMVAQLVAAGHNVTVADDLSTGYAETVPAGVSLVRVGVHDVATVLTAGAGFDGVLHFAAKIAVGESVQHPEWYWHTNVLVASSARSRSELRWAPAKPGLHDIVADAWAFVRNPDAQD